MRFLSASASALACLALGGCLTTGTGGDMLSFLGGAEAPPAEVVPPPEPVPAPPDPALILASIDAAHTELRAGGLKVPLVKPAVIAGVQPAGLISVTPTTPPSVTGAPATTPSVAALSAASTIAGEAPPVLAGSKAPAGVETQHASVSGGGFFGRLLHGGGGGEACPSDLTFYEQHLQRPDAPLVDPAKPVRDYVSAHGGAEAAAAKLKADVASYETALADAKVRRNPFDPRERASADARIAALEDNILLANALLEAIDCSK